MSSRKKESVAAAVLPRINTAWSMLLNNFMLGEQ
jgi:hypothetical protein